jgi:hypothetical protein
MIEHLRGLLGREVQLTFSQGHKLTGVLYDMATDTAEAWVLLADTELGPEAGVVFVNLRHVRLLAPQRKQEGR